MKGLEDAVRSLCRFAALAALGIALLVCLSHAQSKSDVALSESTAYYRLSGETLESLLKQMREKGPADENRRRWFAYTHWYIRWNYVVSRAGSGCEVGSAQVTLQVRFTFPAWDTPSDVAPSVLIKWEEFIRGLTIHENGHKTIALEAARTILQKISSLGSSVNCAEVDQEANALGQRLLQEARENELRYDRETNHGESQGAFLRN